MTKKNKNIPCKTIKELKEKYGNGDKLTIRVDNDSTQVMLTEQYDQYANDDIDEVDDLFEGSGDNDVIDLWQELFPDADVDAV